MNSKSSSDDNVPLNIVRDIYRKIMIIKANNSMERPLKYVDYMKKKNRKNVVIDGHIVR